MDFGSRMCMRLVSSRGIRHRSPFFSRSADSREELTVSIEDVHVYGYVQHVLVARARRILLIYTTANVVSVDTDLPA